MIYIITAGSYSNYHIIAATTDHTEAKLIKKSYNKYHSFDQASIEIFYDKGDRGDRVLFSIMFDLKNSSATVVAVDYESTDEGVWIYTFNGIKYQGRVDVLATDEESAIKISSERYFQKLAEQVK